MLSVPAFSITRNALSQIERSLDKKPETSQKHGRHRGISKQRQKKKKKKKKQKKKFR